MDTVRSQTIAPALALALLATSCTASLDLDRFKTESTLTVDSASITYSDFVFTAKEMTSHVGEYMEWRLVDKSNVVQGKGVYVDVARPDFKMAYPSFIPKASAQASPYRIDFWADHNHNGTYDGISGGINDTDHAWRRVLSDPLPEDVTYVAGRYELDFIHDTAFVDIFTDLAGNKISGADTFLPLKLTVHNAAPYAGGMIEIRVADKASGRLVALHRIGHATDTYDAVVTGVLDEQTPYEISLYVDANGDDVYSAGDPSWITDLVSTAAGITADVDLAALQQTPIGGPQ